MSFRESRNFVEKMRALGYPNLISMDAFRLPNFAQVADILFWLVKCYDPNIDLSDDVSTEQDRIIFIKTIATFMALKAQIKLNTRKLYTADSQSIRELLKIANLLYDARKTNHTQEEDITPPLEITSKSSQLKACRVLASELTQRGATLYDLLTKELDLSTLRSSIISHPFDLKSIETSITESIQLLQQSITTTTQTLENLLADDQNLSTKIEKRKLDYDRAVKRLRSLQSVRPAYMDEFEKIEKELCKYYDVYVQRFRNLSFLEVQLDEWNRVEQDRFEETESNLKKMQVRLREEELRLLRGDKEVRESVKGADKHLASARPTRPHAANQRSRKSLQANSETESISDSDSESVEDEMESVGTGQSASEAMPNGSVRSSPVMRNQQSDDESNESTDEDDQGDNDDIIDQDDDDIDVEMDGEDDEGELIDDSEEESDNDNDF